MSTDNILILARKTKTLLGEDANYILFAEGSAKATFFVTVEYEGEKETCKLGGSAESALGIFLLVSGGGVTPCTLKYVIEDIEYENLPASN